MIDGLSWLFNNPYSYIVIPVAIEQKNDIVKDIILPLIPSLLTIVGWVIVSRQEKSSRAEQKQLLEADIDRANKKERISNILIQITDIKQLTFRYYQLDANNAESIELGLIIPARIQQLNHFINRACCQNQTLPQSISKKFIKFRRVLTGGSFGAAQRLGLPVTDNLYQEIIRAELDLYIEIEKLLP